MNATWWSGQTGAHVWASASRGPAWTLALFRSALEPCWRRSLKTCSCVLTRLGSLSPAQVRKLPLTSEPAVQCKLACSKPAAPKSDSFILLLYRHVPDTHDHGERKSVLACTEGRETRGRARQCIMGLTQKDTWIQGHTCRLFSLLSECARLTVNGNWNTSRNPQREDIEIEEKGLRPKQYIP